GRPPTGVLERPARPPAGAVVDGQRRRKPLADELPACRRTERHPLTQLEGVVLLGERHRVEDPTAGLLLTVAAVGVAAPVPAPPPRGEVADGVVVVVAGQPELAEVVGALDPGGG